ncbi:MAG: hypothetical protein U0903_02170 [Planctomycetales bacterium]
MSGKSSADILERHYLEMRAKLLELAASFDRIDRGETHTDLASDPRMEKLRAGLQIVLSQGAGRAERIQLLFSDEYIPGWQKVGKK